MIRNSKLFILLFSKLKRKNIKNTFIVPTENYVGGGEMLRSAVHLPSFQISLENSSTFLKIGSLPEIYVF